MKHLLLSIAFFLVVSIIFAQSSENYYQAGKIKMDNKNIIEALKDFNAALKLNPKHEMALVCRALCRMTQGKWLLAIPDCDKVIIINPGQAVAYFVRGCAKRKYS